MKQEGRPQKITFGEMRDMGVRLNHDFIFFLQARQLRKRSGPGKDMAPAHAGNAGTETAVR